MGGEREVHPTPKVRKQRTVTRSLSLVYHKVEGGHFTNPGQNTLTGDQFNREIEIEIEFSIEFC